MTTSRSLSVEDGASQSYDDFERLAWPLIAERWGLGQLVRAGTGFDLRGIDAFALTASHLYALAVRMQHNYQGFKTITIRQAEAARILADTPLPPLHPALYCHGYHDQTKLLRVVISTHAAVRAALERAAPWTTNTQDGKQFAALERQHLPEWWMWEGGTWSDHHHRP